MKSKRFLGTRAHVKATRVGLCTTLGIFLAGVSTRDAEAKRVSGGERSGIRSGEQFLKWQGQC